MYVVHVNKESEREREREKKGKKWKKCLPIVEGATHKHYISVTSNMPSSITIAAICCVANYTVSKCHFNGIDQ